MVKKHTEHRPRRGHGGVAPSAEPSTRAGEVWIYGLHPVRAALRNENRKVLRLIGTKEALAHLAEDESIPPRLWSQGHPTDRAGIDRQVGVGAVHQGLA